MVLSCILAVFKIDISDAHKRDHPLTVLLPVILEYIASAQLIDVDSVIEDSETGLEGISNSDVKQEYDLSMSGSMFENLCPATDCKCY